MLTVTTAVDMAEWGEGLGSSVHPLIQVSPHPKLIQAHAAQGGVTLGPEQGELGANFGYLIIFLANG